MIVCRYYKIDSEVLMQAKSGQVNEPRNVLCLSPEN
jgi:hypothetical protein